jgi:hypothetical protein
MGVHWGCLGCKIGVERGGERGLVASLRFEIRLNEEDV